MERFIRHLRNKFTTKERRLIFEVGGKAGDSVENSAADLGAEAAADSIKDNPESVDTPKLNLQNNKDVQEAAVGAQNVLAENLAASTSKQEDTDTTVKSAIESTGEDSKGITEGIEQEQGPPKNHVERISRGITEAGKNYREAGQEFSKAKQDLDAANTKLEDLKKNDPDNTKAIEEAQAEVDAAQEKMDSAKEKQTKAVLETIALIVDFIARLFNGTLLEDPNKPEEDKEKQNENTPQQSNNPSLLVREQIKSGNARTVEQLTTNLNTERTAATEKIQGNNTRIAELRDRTTRLKTDESSLRGEKQTLEAKIASARGSKEEGGDDPKVLEAQLKEVETKLEAVVKEIASNETLIVSLEDDNEEQQNRILGVDRALTEIVLPLQISMDQATQTLGLKQAPTFVNNGTINININGLDGAISAILAQLGITPDQNGDANLGKPEEPKKDNPDAPSEGEPKTFKRAAEEPVGARRKDIEGNTWEKQEDGFWRTSGEGNDSGFTGTSWSDSLMDQRTAEVLGAKEPPADLPPVEPTTLDTNEPPPPPLPETPIMTTTIATNETSEVSTAATEQVEAEDPQVQEYLRATKDVITTRLKQNIEKSNTLAKQTENEGYITSGLRMAREKIGVTTSVDEQQRGLELDFNSLKSLESRLEKGVADATTVDEKIAVINQIRASLKLSPVNIA